MPSNLPFLSIVIPMYNRGREIRRALESCLNQTFGNFEVVVVDDYSEDGSADVVRAYNDPRIQLVQHSRNRGQCPARNSGVQQAKGEWVLFLDSDDEILPGGLATVARRAGECSPDVARVGFSYVLDDGAISPAPGVRPEVVDYEAYIRWTLSLKRSDFLQCTRRNTFDHVRFPDSRMHEVLYNFNFAKEFKTRLFPDAVAQLHTDAANRESGRRFMTDAAELIRRAPDQAAGMEELLTTHGDAICQNAPDSFELYCRMRVTYWFLAGVRRRGFARGARHLIDYPFSLAAWGIVGLGLIGARALAWGSRLKWWISDLSIAR